MKTEDRLYIIHTSENSWIREEYLPEHTKRCIVYDYFERFNAKFRYSRGIFIFDDRTATIASGGRIVFLCYYKGNDAINVDEKEIYKYLKKEGLLLE